MAEPCPEIDEETFYEAKELERGWCPACEEFTTPNVRPKAYGRVCIDCLEHGVCGAEHAAKHGFFRVEGDMGFRREEIHKAVAKWKRNCMPLIGLRSAAA